MSEGGFSLRKWATNDPTLREEIASHEVDNSVTERTSEKQIAEDDQTYAASSLGTNVTDSCENIRKLCKDGVDWDQTISEELYSKVKELKDDLEECKTIQAARCYIEDIADKIKSVELLGFADASIVAYAAVVYIRVLTATANRVQLVACKTRVAPLVKQSIPRLELLSATILARLFISIREALRPIVKISATYCWLDSLTAIYWIRGEDREWKPFV
ncbi:Hypothetical predicted protein [Paramuricea clavata]|uniref:Uncharacterized protein n=1 Tax=Paramuricea clavata TaxID=317549 RepID=A0A7D9LLG1_PARCT|nr:Hypothetical predicted protein [Paramuricea clavata]